MKLLLAKVWRWVRSWSTSTKELSLCHKLWIYNPYIFGTQCRKSLIFQTYIILSNRIHSLKYLRSTTLESKDIGFRKAEFVAKTQFLCYIPSSSTSLNALLKLLPPYIYFLHTEFFSNFFLPGGTSLVKAWKSPGTSQIILVWRERWSTPLPPPPSIFNNQHVRKYQRIPVSRYKLKTFFRSFFVYNNSGTEAQRSHKQLQDRERGTPLGFCLRVIVN